MMKNLLYFSGIFFCLYVHAQNTAVSFNGSTQYISVPDQNSIDLSANFTIEGWLYATGAGSGGTQGGIIINKENSYEIARFGDGTLQYALSANGLGNDWVWVNTGLVVPLNEWTHFAMIKSGTNITFYLNGSAVYSNGSNPASLTANTQLMYLGSRFNGGQFLNSQIDEIRIWNTARTLAEIKTNMFNKNLSNAAGGLVGYYRMNEGTGSSTANSCTNTSGINGTLVNTPAWVTSPVQFSSNALSFDGTNDAVTIADDNSLHISTAITLEAMVYATKNTGVQNVICKSSISVNNGFIFPRTDDGWANAVVYLHFGSSFKTLSASYPSLNAWHHLAVTYDGAIIKMYIDGALANSVAQTGVITTNTNPLILGNQPGVSEYFGGYTDEVRIWNVARTQAQIQAAQNMEIDPAIQTGLVSYYTLNQGITSGTNTGLTTVIDQKGNNNGTLSNFAFSGAASNFVPQFASLAALPVSWLSFTAQKKYNHVLLNWSTASEQNAAGYTVQHSINGTSWDNIGNAAAAGNSLSVKQYSFVHNSPSDGINFYRIMQQDSDGKTNYSKIVRLIYASQVKQLTVYPNPVTDGILHVQLQQAATVFMYNSSGKLILRKQLPAGTQQLNMTGFAKDIYQLKSGTTTEQIVLQ